MKNVINESCINENRIVDPLIFLQLKFKGIISLKIRFVSTILLSLLRVKSPILIARKMLLNEKKEGMKIQ